MRVIQIGLLVISIEQINEIKSDIVGEKERLIFLDKMVILKHLAEVVILIMPPIYNLGKKIDTNR